MTSLFYRLYPKDASIPDHTETPAARWAKIRAHGGKDPGKEPGQDELPEKAAQEAEPSDTTMSGALAGLAFLQSGASEATDEGASVSRKRKAEEEVEVKQEDLSKLSVKELKQRIQAAGIKLPPGAAEKADLVAALQGKDQSEEKIFV
eukprot:TRINITY_DN55066_c0_g1_i1.p1 TRINITY_DN55066_c0_g1~~TRINITY_DN55066_c0_g1_i1.p1  ORF type:complete len:148 (+),score=53.83 TRINITY_DN55066_c0_g1_i1:71-514(+)